MKKHLIIISGLLLLFLSWGCTQGKENNKPVIVSLTASSTTRQPGQAATLTVSADDEDDDTLDYEWETNGGTLNNNKGTTVYWTAPGTYGTYSIEVTVDDGEDKDRATISIIVTEEPKITNISVDPNPVAAGADVDLVVTISPDSTDLTVSWSAPDGGTLNTASGKTVTWTASSNPGNYDIIVTVSDGINSDSLTVEIQVT